MAKIKIIDIDFDWSSVKGSTENHNEFKRQFGISVPQHYFNSMVLPYDVAFVRAYSQPEICFRVGQVGVLDTVIILPKVTLWFDMKTGKARLSLEQRNFCKQLTLIHGQERGFKITSIRQGLEIIAPHYD